MKIQKSSRHSKIAGDFGERLVLYWLSKYNFECAYVDHVGIDIIANNPHTGEVMGISVKTRTRGDGKAGEPLHIPNTEIEKMHKACKAFGCSPYFAIVVDQEDSIHTYIVREEKCRMLFKRERVMSWKMNQKWLDKYKNDSDIMYFGFKTSIGNWWKKQ